MTARVPTIAAAILLATGCAPVNEQVGLIDADPLPALDPDAETVSVTASSTPSINSHDRRHWETQSVLVPLKQVEHRPDYTEDLSLTDATPRQRGEFPTAESSLDIEQNSGDLVLEAAGDPFFALAQVVWWPFDWGLNNRAPWSIERGPADDYEAVPDTADADYWRWIDTAGGS